MNDSYIIRKLSKTDEKQLNNLIREVESGLKKETFWLPITEISRMHFFDDTWTYFLGVFNKEEELIGAVALFFNENEYGESAEVLGLRQQNLAEYGRAMVRPDYQGQGIMKSLSAILIEHAKKMGIKRIIATVHPDNIASQSVIKSLGFIKKAFIRKMNRYDRDIFLMEL